MATLVGSTPVPELLFYNASGGLDPAFGGGTGIVTLTGFTGWTSITGIVVQSDGDIDLAAVTTSGGMNVAQLNADGSADTSFGSSGLKTLSSLPAADDMVLASNGQLLVAGISSLSFDVAELNVSDGSLYTGYNTSGSARIAVSSTGSSFTFIGMATAPDGDLILVGRYTTSGSSGQLVMAALSPSGYADTSFETSPVFPGVVKQGWNSPIAPGLSPVAITPDGDILMGDAANSAGHVILAVNEFSPKGALIAAFGTSGQASVTVSGSSTSMVLGIQADGQIVLGVGLAGGNLDLVRFNSNGSLDTTFGTSGIETGAAEGGGLAMVTAANGESVIIGKVSSGNGIILEEFGTLASHQTLYAEYDADYNVTSLTNASGGVLERYAYDGYGNVTVLNANGTVRGDGTAASSFYGWVYLHQGLRLSVVTGLYDDRHRQTYDPALGRFLQEDPTKAEYVDGVAVYQIESANPIDRLDPTGLILIGSHGTRGSAHASPPPPWPGTWNGLGQWTQAGALGFGAAGGAVGAAAGTAAGLEDGDLVDSIWGFTKAGVLVGSTVGAAAGATAYTVQSAAVWYWEVISG